MSQAATEVNIGSNLLPLLDWARLLIKWC